MERRRKGEGWREEERRGESNSAEDGA